MKTLILEKIIASKQTIRYCYIFDGDHFERGHDFDDSVDFDGYADDPTFTRLLSYSAIADSVYTFGLGYYDEVQLPFLLDDVERKFFETVFLNGLAEFRYINEIPIRQAVRFTATADAKAIASTAQGSSKESLLERAYVLNGGGKDGAVAIEMAKLLDVELAWFTSGNAESRSRIVDASGVSDWTQAQRFSDGYVKAHSVMKGHKPMSFYVSMVASLAAYATDRRYVVAANEYSASFPNIEVDGFWVNHQYSKSSDYEELLSMLFEHAKIPVEYFSITRPLYELQIMRIFANHAQYHAHFLSCNKGMSEDRWCMDCAKCAFVIGSLYVENEASARELWGDPRSVFAGNSLVDELIELVNVAAKPLECIGTIAENRYLVGELLKRDLIVLTQDQTARLDKLMAAGSGVEKVDFDAYERPGYFPSELSEKVRTIIKKEMEGIRR